MIRSHFHYPESFKLLTIFICVGILTLFVYRALLGYGEIMGGDSAHVLILACNTPPIFELFYLEPGDRYRPLSVLLESTYTCLYGKNELVGWLLLILIAGAMNGVALFLVFGIAKIVSNSNRVGALSAGLFFFSNTFIVSNLGILIWAPQVIPLVFVLAAIFSYLKYGQTKRGYWVLLLAMAGIIGVYFREVAALGLLAIAAMEILRFPRYPRLFTALAVLLALHAIYPTALLSFLGLYGGTVRNLVGFSEISANFREPLFNWWRTGRILAQVPFIIWVLIATSIAAFIYRLPASRWTPKVIYHSMCSFWGKDNEIDGGIAHSPISRWVAAGFLLFSLLAFLPLFLGHYALPEVSPFAVSPEIVTILFVVLFLFFTCIRYGALLPIWFGTIYLPLLRQPDNFEIHLTYVTAPLSIMAALWLFRLFAQLKTSTDQKTVSYRWMLAAFVILLVGLLDQVQNVQLALRTNKSLLKVTSNIALWINNNIPNQSVIFVNTFAGLEVFIRTGAAYDMRWISRVGPLTHIPGRESLWDPSAQEKYIRNSFINGASVYYLLDTSNAWPTQIPISDLSKIREWSVELPQYSLDPLRYFTKKPQYIQYLGPTQWRRTFEQFGNTNSATSWTTSFALYALNPRDTYSFVPINNVSARTNTTLLVDGYKDTHYNILSFGQKYYAVHRGEGPFDPSKDMERRTALPVYVADTLEDLTRQISRGTNSAADINLYLGRSYSYSADANASVSLLIDGYKDTNYNILLYRGKFYAVHRGEGSFDPATDLERETRNPVFVGDTLEEAKIQIEQGRSD